jgi:hypothetical protein
VIVLGGTAIFEVTMNAKRRWSTSAPHPRWRAALLAASLVSLLAIRPAWAETIRDDFPGPDFSPEIWYPCRRDENMLSIVPAEGFNAAKLVVNPRVSAGIFGLGRRYNECRKEAGVEYPRQDDDERAELWEAEGTLLRFGSDIWYRFVMFIDPNIPAGDGNRLIIGQWKEDGGHSPMVAQRFSNRRFTITIEQDNDDPERSAGDDECRIVVARDSGLLDVVRADLGLALGTAPAAMAARDVPLAGSVGHDRFDIVHETGLTPAATAELCARDLSITPYGTLPNPFGVWTTMLYHLRATADAGGLLEIWANGVPIVALSGRFGFRDHRADMQYFKFGPYRNHVNYSSYALLTHYARGDSRAEVE